jgi:hypothetical protein
MGDPGSGHHRPEWAGTAPPVHISPDATTFKPGGEVLTGWQRVPDRSASGGHLSGWKMACGPLLGYPEVSSSRATNPWSSPIVCWRNAGSFPGDYDDRTTARS